MGRFLNWINKDTVIQGARYKDKEEVLKAIASCAKKSPALKNIPENSLFSALKDRELLGTTGFGNGIAIPHCRLYGIKEFIVGIITSADGIDFESLDGKPVHLFVFIIAPEHETNQHIRLLSAISRVCQNQNAVNEIVNQKSSDEIINTFSGYLNEKIDIKEKQKRFLFNICTGNIEFFQEILQIFTGMNNSSVYIYDARQPREYLSEMPLFMGFWGDTVENPWQCISATIEEPIVNDTIRKIENITGNLEVREDISVTVTELYYSSGIIKT
ncbi:MAG: PTS sugar transporter subunit IIA [Victivallales bacterium]|nr:PTS sugar transporter subunit IIA [Victivallales bacterium]MCF7888823.1 PTS sugar transporter subunit IIA [Victivallales bacterium]